MMFELRWVQYDKELQPMTRVHIVESEACLREILDSIKKNRGIEEVILELKNDNLSGRDLSFRYSDDRTCAYATYGQQDRGYFESVGDPESPEAYTSDGGSYSAGTAVPVTGIEQAVVEFFHTNEMPTAISWVPSQLSLLSRK